MDDVDRVQIMLHARRRAHSPSTRSGVDGWRRPPMRLTDWARPDGGPMPTPRFLTLDDVAEILNVSWSQAYALVRRKELIAIQIGGRGAWRVEVDELERFIQQKYAEARAGTVPEKPPPADDEGEAPDAAPAEPATTPGRRRQP
jgi:excisionase family DNA binding protein